MTKEKDKKIAELEAELEEVRGERDQYVEAANELAQDKRTLSKLSLYQEMELTSHRANGHQHAPVEEESG